ncbi:hypothetical protein, partial [Xanthomonas oryzae]|uniref:hypothetical protein n=1 Tax=Xanthomonas oryzae TaxID=347 RepID=UPI002DE36878|nr:hypothetical protein [Xanthomonas oryzae pv. oryzicola]
EADDLLFGKTLLHVQSPRGRELDSKLRCYSNLGGRRGDYLRRGSTLPAFLLKWQLKEETLYQL